MKRFLWPGMLFVLVGATMVLNGVMLIVSGSDPSFALDPAYEEGGSSVVSPRQPAWTLALETESDATGLTRCELAVNDDGRPLRDAHVSVAAFHHARASDERRLELLETDPGRYAADLAVDRAGRWGFRVTVERDGLMHVETIDVVLEPSP